MTPITTQLSTATPGSAYASAPDLTPQGGSYRNLDDFLALFG